MARRSHFWLLTTSGAASVTTALAEYLSFLLLTEVLRVHYVVSSVLVGVGGLLLLFALNRFWAFRDVVPEGFGRFVRFVVTTGIGIGGGAALLYLLVDVVGIPSWVGWVVQNLGVFVVWTYPVYRYYVFPAPSQGRPSSP